MIKKILGGAAALIIAGAASATIATASAAQPEWHGDGSTVCPAGFYPYEGDCYPDELLDHDPNYVPKSGGNGSPATTEESAPATVTVTKTKEAKPTKPAETANPEPEEPGTEPGDGGDGSGTGNSGGTDTGTTP